MNSNYSLHTRKECRFQFRLQSPQRKKDITHTIPCFPREWEVNQGFAGSERVLHQFLSFLFLLSARILEASASVSFCLGTQQAWSLSRSWLQNMPILLGFALFPGLALAALSLDSFPAGYKGNSSHQPHIDSRKMKEATTQMGAAYRTELSNGG